jgi:hypothetical protein
MDRKALTPLNNQMLGLSDIKALIARFALVRRLRAAVGREYTGSAPGAR